MKNFKILVTLFVAIFVLSCSKEKNTIQVIEIPIINKEVFNSTQKYEILCWCIKRGEGYSSKVYKCSANKRTIGYGFTNVKYIKNIHHADIIFQKMVLSLFNQVSKEYPQLNYLQKSAIVSLLYNTGDLEKIKNSGFSKALLLKDNKKAIKNFQKWCKVRLNNKTITVKGLQNRRSYESKLLNNSFTMADYVSLKQEIHLIYLNNKS